MNHSQRLDHFIVYFQAELHAIPDEEFSHKPAPGKWSKQEIIGHLCDSAANNHIRFMNIALSGETIKLAGYNQDQWVDIHDYQNSYNKLEMIQLWGCLNKQIAGVLAKLTDEDCSKKCILNVGEEVTLEWLVNDYFEHMLHHFKQILGVKKVEQAAGLS